MKTDLKAKYIQHLINKKKNDEGFTLIELLVVIIIIGILSAIALPSFLNQANKAKQSEAKTYVGSMNRGQQAFYTERTEFSANLEDLGIGIAADTLNYSYETFATDSTATTLLATSYGDSLKDPLRSYYGNVWLKDATATAEATTLAIVCERTTAGITTNTAVETTINGCATDWRRL
ncbi:MAG: type IV pilin-like G/H family protein [Cyanobacteria bacterium P01_F01_bin.150]